MANNKNKNEREASARRRAKNFGFSSSGSLLQGIIDAIARNRPLKLQLELPSENDITTYGEYHPSCWTSHELGAVVIPCNVKLISSYERKYGEVHSMATGPGGVLYTGSDSKNIRVWVHGQLSGGFKAKNGPNYALLLDPQARLFAGNYDGAVRAWVKKNNNTQVEHLPHTKIQTLPLLQDRLKVSFWRTKMKLMRKSDHLYWFSFPVTCISMSKDMKFLYTGSVDQSIKIWRLSDWKLIDCKVEHTDMVSAVAAGCDDLVFSGSKDGSIIMWQRKEKTNGKGVIHSLTQILLSGTTSVNALMLKYSVTGTGELYAGLSNGNVMFWEETKSWSTPAVFSCHDKAVTCLAGSHGMLVFSGSEDGKIYVWRREPDTAIHSLMTVVIDHQGPINCLATQEDWEENDNGPCRCILYSASKDKTLKTWRFADSALEDQCGR